MAINSLRVVVILLAWTSVDSPPSESASLGPFEVLAVTPARRIDHDLELQGPLDDKKIETTLSGPDAFSLAVDFKNRPQERPEAYLNWYTIVRPTKEPGRVLTVRDAGPGGKEHTITIGDAAFLLSPAQRIATGAPSPLPEDLNCFKAYKVTEGPEVGRRVQLSGTLGAEDRTLTKAVYICLPVEQWHHDAHVPVKNRQSCLLVYALNSQDHQTSVTTLDQFGLNRLQTRASSWLCLPVQLVTTKRDGRRR